MDLFLSVVLVFVVVLVIVGVALLISAPFAAEPKQFEMFYGKQINILANFRFIFYKYYKHEKMWICTAIRRVWLTVGLSTVILIFLASL